MAIEKEIKITVDKSKAEKDVKKLDKGIEGVDKTAKGASTSIKAIGGALKAIGIGLIVALFAKLAEVLSKNQKVMDLLATTSETLSIIFNDLFSYLEKTLPKIIDFFKQVFDDPIGSIKDLGNAIQANLTERFFSLLEATGLVAKAVKQFLAGDFADAFDTAKEAGKEFFDVATGVNDSFDKTVDLVKEAAEGIAEYAKETYNQAKAYVQLQNNAKLAAAEQARLVEIYDRQAEQLRQVRDADLNSLSDRIEANEKLSEVLEKQQKAMLAAADAQVAAAKFTADQNNNIENRVALTEALTNREGVLAQIEGQRSEQLANRNALLRERIELDQSIEDAEKERQIAQLEFEAEQEENELKRLEAEREALMMRQESELAELERKRELYNEDTQARVDAEQAYLDAKQEIENAITANLREESIERERLEKAVQDAKVSLAYNTLDLLGAVAKEGSDLAKGVAVAQATINGFQGVQNAFTTAAANPITTVFPAYPFVQAGLAGALSAVQIANILKTDPTGKSVGSTPNSSSGSAGAGAAAPSFNLVQGTGENQIAESVQAQNQRPVRAFVVGKSVTTQQEMDRNIESGAKIG